MKKLFFLILLLPFWAEAGLDETSFFSSDGSCQVHYLTTSPKDEWTFQLTQGNCVNGWVQGYAQMDVYNAQHRLVEKLQGFFMDGYWMGSFAANGHILQRTTPEEKEQAISFVLEQDEKITYVVQLRSVQTEEGAYGPFLGCPAFRLMAVVSEASLFKQESFQNKIVARALDLAQRYCVNLDQIALFGATKLMPEKEDILFQMSLDPNTEERTIVLQKEPESILPQDVDLKSSEKKSSVLKRTNLAHLDVLSRLSNQPQKGKVVVHVYQLNLDGTAFVDLPEQVTLKNNSRLKEGWALVEGSYYQKEMSVFEIQPCQKEWCSDVQ